MLSNLQLPEGRRVDVGGPIHYREWPGPSDTTFVCIHGLGGFHLNWMAVAPGLSERGRVVALDLPGFGLSSLGGRGARMTDTLPVLASFVRGVASGRVVLVGNSMGGSYAALLAALEPDLVDGVVLTCPALPWAAGVRPTPLIAAAFAAYRTPGLGEWLVAQRAHRLSPERTVALGFHFCAANPSAIDAGVVDAHVDLVRARHGDPQAPEAFVEAARSLIALGLRPVLARKLLDRVRCPVLLLHGRRDRLVPVGLTIAAAEAHPEWRLRIFPSLGHVPMLEDPAGWLAAVGAWLPAAERVGSSRLESGGPG